MLITLAYCFSYNDFNAIYIWQPEDFIVQNKEIIKKLQKLM